jgi:uncharacterized protein YjbI with pentapeptide repeats
MDLINADLSFMDLSNVNFECALMTGANLSNSKLQNSITGPVLINDNNIILPHDYQIASSENSEFKFIIGPNISLINKDLSFFDLSNANLTGSNLIFSDLSNTNLSNINLTNTCLPSIVGPLDLQTIISIKKNISLEEFEGAKWLVYKQNNYKWDKFNSNN